MYVSDNLGHVIALGREQNEVWRVDVGEPLVGSISVSPDNNELCAVTRGANLMLHMGMGLLDRETGELRYFAEGRGDCTLKLTPAEFDSAVTETAAACAMFATGRMNDLSAEAGG